MLDFLMLLDRDLFLFLNGLNTPWLDPVMYWISDKFIWIPLYVVLLWFVYKHYGWKNTLVIILLIVLLITLTDQVTGFMKSYFQRFRPSRDEALEGLVHTVKGYRGGRFGFVSSHAANTIALAIFMIHLLQKSVKGIVPVVLVYALLNSYSRMYLGVHYPGDILGGLLVGIIIALLISRLWTFLAKKYNLLTPARIKV